ncbi:tRNA(Arg) A34 adenosine deaminase TadA [Luteibacter sp. Sphag1AF]|uniref:nucleoside deaminase n=1 Tax=Luteibacter sp. Sphag1AF TaxID=2587031 RepID=UPI00160A5633|nr:nucleoside deaminase [Luteibacter sp. Sphag1AF]MBB3227546.1 tRNA(Arg) A34 adenosine deaminase TadA [Luteibacter sp. Sphag1AF]
MIYAQVHLTLPAWVHEAVDANAVYPDDAAKVGLAIRLSADNVDLATGGPFGAAVFDGEHRLIAVGVNRVVPHTCSVAHAEMMAYMTAQQRLQRFRLNEDGGSFSLATSSQPCCQCYGATVWAGVNELLIGARAEDVEELTEFDEGPLPADWVGELEKRGIAVRRDILRDEARDVLRRYGESGTHY